MTGVPAESTSLTPPLESSRVIRDDLQLARTRLYENPQNHNERILHELLIEARLQQRAPDTAAPKRNQRGVVNVAPLMDSYISASSDGSAFNLNSHHLASVIREKVQDPRYVYEIRPGESDYEIGTSRQNNRVGPFKITSREVELDIVPPKNETNPLIESSPWDLNTGSLAGLRRHDTEKNNAAYSIAEASPIERGSIPLPPPNPQQSAHSSVRRSDEAGQVDESLGKAFTTFRISYTPKDLMDSLRKLCRSTNQ